LRRAKRKPSAVQSRSVPATVFAANGRTRRGSSDGSVVERTVHVIREGLRDGRYAPGQRLIEGELCAETGVSRSTVREALRRLAAEGFLEIEHHRGARIRRLALDEVLEIYAIRESLEGLAAQLAARSIKNGGNCDRLLQLERKFDAGFDGSPQRYMAYNVEFHRVIVDMSGNAKLLNLIEQLELPAFLSLLRIIVEPSAMHLSRGEHRPIVSAIVDGDERAARKAMQDHIGRTARYIRAQADDTSFPTPETGIAERRSGFRSARASKIGPSRTAAPEMSGKSRSR
jgi:DNA-binding GntR family transcriptional regulator